LNNTYTFNFEGLESTVYIQDDVPSLDDILLHYSESSAVIVICDTNTKCIAEQVINKKKAALCVIEAGETAKNWESVEKILCTAQNASLARDSIFIAVGGGVVTDIAGFASSIYMRGANLVFVTTTLLGMADAALGGKTGFDIFERKNLAGTFYPASYIYMPLSVLNTLNRRQIKSGFAEIIKTIILDSETEDTVLYNFFLAANNSVDNLKIENNLQKLISISVRIKGKVVEEDPKETGEKRALLNLGHTFAHALESSAGLGALTHGEAVAWGIAAACKLGIMLGITNIERAQKIISFLNNAGYETAMPHSMIKDADFFIKCLFDDKKKKSGKLRFVVPFENGAKLIFLENEKINLIKDLVYGKQ
jgi:3-dehydroquinate synthase